MMRLLVVLGALAWAVPASAAWLWACASAVSGTQECPQSDYRWVPENTPVPDGVVVFSGGAACAMSEWKPSSYTGTIANAVLCPTAQSDSNWCASYTCGAGYMVAASGATTTTAAATTTTAAATTTTAAATTTTAAATTTTAAATTTTVFGTTTTTAAAVSCVPAARTRAPCPSGYAPSSVPLVGVIEESYGSALDNLPVQEIIVGALFVISGLLGVGIGAKL